MPKLNKWDSEAIKNTERFALQIDAIYKTAAKEAAKIGVSVSNFNPEVPFTFKDYPQTKKLIDKLMKDLQANVSAVVLNGIETQWDLANQKNDELVNKAFRMDVRSNPKFENYFNNHDTAQQAFKERVRGGLNLSDRVWNYTNQFKEEIEMAIDLGIGSGQSAAELARDIKQYLNEPDKLFRRVRDKHGQLQLSKNAKAYKPGQGNYRSSYKNARRVAVTETNMAYHAADKERWDNLDFVVGIEVRLSNNHTLNGVPFVDICDDLKGKYPKDFKFIGWHPHCYDEQSEVLTNRGWKFFKDILDTDKIFSLIPETKNTEWVDILLNFKKEHKGEMIHFYNKNLDCLVTPEHEMLYLNKSDGNFKRKNAKDFGKGNGSFYRSSNWVGKDYKNILIGKTIFDFRYFSEFMGYWLSDGSLIRDYQIKIAQKEGDLNREKITKCIENLGLKVGKTVESIDCYSKDLNKYLKQFGKSENKFIPLEIKESKKENIETFLNAFISCDGYIKKPGKPFINDRGKLFTPINEERLYFSSSKQLVSDLGELLVKIGKRPSYRVSKTEGKMHKFKNGTYMIKNDLIVVAECSSQTATVFSKESIDYDGFVYDLTLSKNSIMYIRRNGKCFWGSNCRCHAIPVLKSQSEMDAELDAVLSGKEVPQGSENVINDTPPQFKKYVSEQKDRINEAIGRKKEAYWIKDNKQFVKELVK